MNKVGITMAAATLALSCLAGQAQGQISTVHNASFETRALCASSQVSGWRRYNGATWYSGDRTANPNSAPLPPGILPRTGQGMIGLPTGPDFTGAETEDRLYDPSQIVWTDQCQNGAPPPPLPFNPAWACLDADCYPPENFPFPWVAYTYEPELDGDPVNGRTCDVAGGGTITRPDDPINLAAGAPITIKGWYLIPAASPIVGTRCGIKATFQSDFVNNAGQLGNWFIREDLTIDGNVPGGVHTNGVWTEFSMTINQSDFPDPQECWVPPIGGMGYIKLTLVQFDADVDSASGIIYWDDISVSQGETPCQIADFSPPAGVDVVDLFDFLDAWFAQSGVCTSGCTADIDNDNDVDVVDLFTFLDYWFLYSGTNC